MKTASIPLTVHPRRIAQSGNLIEGSLMISRLPNLCEVLTRDEGCLDIVLSAKIDEQHRVFLQGNVKGQVWLTCQLCMEPLAVDINQSFDLLIVITEEQAEQALKKYEPLLVDSDDVDVITLIEQEVMLALPIAPAHDRTKACLRHESFDPESNSDEAVEEDAETTMPFSDLKTLLAGNKPEGSNGN